MRTNLFVGSGSLMLKAGIISAILIFGMSCSEKPMDCIDESRINPEAMCTMDYTPVCGCDARTYGNACQAEAAGVLSWEEGECKS